LPKLEAGEFSSHVLGKNSIAGQNVQEAKVATVCKAEYWRGKSHRECFRGFHRILKLATNYHSGVRKLPVTRDKN
jgi:uncharacterized protein with PIN domain